MRSANFRWLWATVALALAAVGGCANDAEPINRVQPNALSKAMFDSEQEWYTMGHVADISRDAPVNIGNTTAFERIRWEIQEDFLLAKRTHEKVKDAEGNSGVLGDEIEKTSVVAAYAIESHFDIRRQYNPVTGEESNVIEENSVDRPWYEREYFRVDWSENVLEDSLTLAYSFGGVKITPLSFYEQDVGQEIDQHSLEPKFEFDENGEVKYFEIFNRYWAEPAMARAQLAPGQWAEVPACMLNFNQHIDCSPGAVGIRHSFVRVPDRDYQPNPYTPDRMERFGYFLTQRDNYDRSQGVNVGDREVYNVRFNLWQKSHLTDANGERVVCPQSGSCGDIQKGSVCDKAYGTANDTAALCTLPYTEREVRPIVYYMTDNMPEDLQPTAMDVSDSWNGAFVETVASLRRIECEEHGLGDCSQYTPENTERVFVGCHNPVVESDHDACGEVGFNPQYGDIRYSFMAWIDDPHGKYSGAPLGLGPAYNDPLTGEVYSAMANLYGAGFDTLVAYARDILAMMNGDLEETETYDSADYQAWREALEGRALESKLDSITSRGTKLEEIRESNAMMDFSWAMNRLPNNVKAQSWQDVARNSDAMWHAVGGMHENLGYGRQTRANLRQLQGTVIEEMMINEDHKVLAGLDPDTALTDDVIEQVSPLRQGGAMGIRTRHKLRQQLMRKFPRFCQVEASDFLDDGLLGLLEEIKRAAQGDGNVEWYGRQYNVGGGGTIDYEAVEKMLRQPVFFGLTAHEVGHNLGLRHNFNGSFDALNYKDEYWPLRNADGTIESRFTDPMNQQEIDGRIREYEYSTVMDYGHNFVVTDPHGVGHYDHAAIKMGYGDLHEVFTDVPASNAMAVAQIASQSGPFMVFRSNPLGGGQGALTALHYSQWPSIVGGIENIKKRTDVKYESLTSVADGLFGNNGKSMTEDGRPAVPYLYCGDEFRDSRPTCMLYDAGADAYETMKSIIDSYWYYYPFSHFQRHRIGWDPASVGQRSYGRFLTKLESAMHIYALYRQFLEPQLGTPFFEDPNGFGLYTQGVKESYDLLRKIITTPEPGNRGVETTVDGMEFVSSDFPQDRFGEQYNIDAFQGRYLRSQYEFGPDFAWIHFTGAAWSTEKDIALATMLFQDTGFLGVDTSPDIREYSSSYYTVFPQITNEFLRAIYAQDFRSIGPRLVQQPDGRNELVFPSGNETLKRGVTMNEGIVVEPNLRFTLQVASMAYGMSLIPRSFDQDFVNRARVFASGGAEGVDLNLPDGTASFFDERSGMTYFAGSYHGEAPEEMDVETVETGPAAAMINYANELKAKVEELEAAEDFEAAARWEAKLNDYVDNLNIMRRLTWTLGFGNGSGYLDEALNGGPDSPAAEP